MCDFYRSRAATKENLWRYHRDVTTESDVCSSSWFTNAIGSATQIAVKIASKKVSKSSETVNGFNN